MPPSVPLAYPHPLPIIGLSHAYGLGQLHHPLSAMKCQARASNSSNKKSRKGFHLRGPDRSRFLAYDRARRLAPWLLRWLRRGLTLPQVAARYDLDLADASIALHAYEARDYARN